MFIYNLILMLLATLIIASITLVERKVLSLCQRRVGPFFVGYKGRLQYIADALKLLAKGYIIPAEVNQFWFITAPAIALSICFSFWINSVWGYNFSIFELEYNIVYAGLLSVIFNFCIVFAGYFSRNKFGFLSAVRACILTINLELLLGLLFLNLTLIGESFSFMTYLIYQEFFWLFLFFFNTAALIIITFLLETNRAPFDLAEAESELVAGYSTEYGSFFFALFYLGEYFHLFFFSLIMVIFFFGGQSLPYFLFYFITKDWAIF
jgi:NADH:ubiquinone oxidoreductase subunit H